MAECPHARCMQERRAIRKELQRWTKNMVFVVGLERVAEELMGRRKWRQLGTIGTWEDLDTACPADGPADCREHGPADPKGPLPLRGPQDFEPRQECCFCDSPLDSTTRIASDSEDDSGSVASEGEGASLGASLAGSLGGACVPANMTTLEAVTSMAASLAAVAAFKSSQGGNASATSTTSSSPQPAPGLYPLGHPGLLPAWYLSSPHAAAVAAVAAAAQQQQQQESSRSSPLDTHRMTTSSPGPSHSPGLGPGAGPSPVGASTPGYPPAASSPCSPSGAGGTANMSPSDMPMPLDLSAKAAALAALAMERDMLRDSLRVPDSKNIFKARPRANTALTQRRTYTEDELQAALRDIQSGKLGTRRAAVIYGIPRSTLRNKVYKLTMERKCDPASLVGLGADPSRLPLAALALPPEDDDGALSPGEDDLAEKGLKLDSPASLAPESLRLLLQQGMRGRRAGGSAGEESEEGASPPPSASGLPPAFPGAEQWGLAGAGVDYSALAPYISKLLGAQQSLLARNLPGSGPGPATPGGSGSESPSAETGDFLPKFASPLLPDFLYRMMTEERGAQGQSFHNGSGSSEARDGRDGRDGEDRRSTAASPSLKSEADDDGRPTSPPNVILKIPSYRPSKNGGVDSVGFSPSQLSEQGAAAPAPAVSPPTAAQILANKALASKFPHLRLGPTSPGGGIFDLKRGLHYGSSAAHHAMAESVIKSMQQQAASRSTTSTTNTTNTSSSGQPASGKGTRPKRGKYRNYDRDALNEAVKAVQRGEMSVHRAGSYYGVPHSTLEYKVKERHLMRPRKRDPKPQAPTTGQDDKSKQDGNVPVSNVLRLSPGEKITLPGLPGMPGLGGPGGQGAPGTSKAKPFIQPPMAAPQNGLKSRFDSAAIPSLAAYPGIPPFPFWGAGYGALPLDFSGQTPPFNSNTKQFLASQMMQRLQDAQDSGRNNTSASGPPPPGVQGAAGGPPGPGPGPSPGPGSSPESRTAGALGLTPGLTPGMTPPGLTPGLTPPGLAPGLTPEGSPSRAGAAALALGLKRSRDSEDNMDDSSSDNNTLLDGIIRYGLDKGLSRPSKEAVEKMANNALLEQLCRSRLDGRLDGRLDIRLDQVRQRTSSSSEDEEVRRPPLSLLHTNVVHLSPSSDGSGNEEKNSRLDNDGEKDRDEDERLPRPNSGHPASKPFHLNHSPPRPPRPDRPDSPRDNPRDSPRDSRPGAVNGLEAARSASRADEDFVKSASACDSKLESRTSSRGGAMSEEDGAKDSNEDQVREDTKTQDIS